MSTRCQIGFYSEENSDLDNWEVLIYRHSSGYPDDVIGDILPILKDFDENRGLSDLEYAGAWLVTKLKDNYLDIGISKDWHGDLAYYYAICPKNIRVFSVNYPFEGKKSFSLINTISIK